MRALSRRSIGLALAAIAGCGSIPGVESDGGAIDAAVDTSNGDAPIDGAPTGDAAPDAVPPTGLVVEGEVGWDSTHSSIALGAADHRLCFLQQVAGQLAVSGGEVRVYVLDGVWYLGGSAPVIVAATARCVRWSDAGGVSTDPSGFDWTQGQAPVAMGAAADRICGLTRVAGRFEGGGELVHAAIAGGAWSLSGTSATTGVAASARCLAWPAGAEVVSSGETNWAQGQPEQNLGAVADRACVLTLITGAFHGLGENVHITTDGTSWLLTGASLQVGVAARAKCIAW